MEVIREEQKEDTFIEGEEGEEETNFIVFLGTAESSSGLEIGIVDTKPCEFKIEELVSMHIKQSFSFVLTKSCDVLVFGNFANMLSP